MSRSIFLIAIAVAVVAPAPMAFAQPTPSAADLEKAKKAFGEGKALFDKGDFPEAIAKFKESYALSKNPVLLYNIGFANESAAQDDIALFYYRKFLADAPPAATQRAEVTERVKALEKKFQSPTAAEPTKAEPTKAEPVAHEPAKPIVIKPAGTYAATDFQHQTIEVAPPAKPLDVTAFVPEDSGWNVTLYFRTAGEGKFTSKPMKWRYKELVARIPPNKMIGTSVQYYIEAKDQAGAVVTRAGKSTSPNLVNLEAGATPKFYPDFTEEGTVQSAAETKAQDEEDDPLNAGKKHSPKVKEVDPDQVVIQPAPGGTAGFNDVGSSKFKYTKWAATGVAAVGVGLGVVFYIQASKQATALADDSKMSMHVFDQYDKDLESAGKRDQSLSTVGFVIGGAAVVVAGYFWYKELTAKKRGELKISGKKSPSPETSSSWVVAPSLGDGFAGAAAAARF